jgi:penicillin-binding protein 2
MQIHYTDINAQYFPIVKEGMRRMMINTGAGIRNSVLGIEIAGKTGTTQNPHGENHSMYVGFAPFDNPQIAIAVVVENSGFGATYALPIASLMIEQYISGEVKRSYLLERMENMVTNPNVRR